MTIEQIDARIAELTAELHGDDRPTRDQDGEKLDEGAAIRDERAAVKAERRALRNARKVLLLQLEAVDPPRSRDQILAALDKARAVRAKAADQCKALARELDRRDTADELAAMPPAKRAALAQMLDAERIASAAKVHGLK